MPVCMSACVRVHARALARACIVPCQYHPLHACLTASARWLLAFTHSSVLGVVGDGGQGREEGGEGGRESRGTSRAKGEPRGGGGGEEGRGRTEVVDSFAFALPNLPSIVRHASVTRVTRVVDDRIVPWRVPRKRGTTSGGVGGGGGGGEDIDKQSGGDCVRRSRSCSVHGGPLPLVPAPLRRSGTRNKIPLPSHSQ